MHKSTVKVKVYFKKLIHVANSLLFIHMLCLNNIDFKSS